MQKTINKEITAVFTEYEKGQFGRFNFSGGKYAYGYYLYPSAGGWPLGVSTKGNELITLSADTFTPCYEPLPLEPSFEEWTRMFMAVAKAVMFVRLGAAGRIEYGYYGNDWYSITYDLDMWKCEGGKDITLTRTDLFPPPEPDWRQYIGHFGRFWDDDYKRADWGYLDKFCPGSDSPFHRQYGGWWGHFSPELPPAKLED